MDPILWFMFIVLILAGSYLPWYNAEQLGRFNVAWSQGEFSNFWAKTFRAIRICNIFTLIFAQVTLIAQILVLLQVVDMSVYNYCIAWLFNGVFFTILGFGALYYCAAKFSDKRQSYLADEQKSLKEIIPIVVGDLQLWFFPYLSFNGAKQLLRWFFWLPVVGWGVSAALLTERQSSVNHVTYDD